MVLPPKAKGLTDRLSGNHFWRSLEASARGVQNTPSDVYSFAIVVSSPAYKGTAYKGSLSGTQAIFAWTGSMVFFTDKANRASPEEQADLILRRHLSFFAREMDDFKGFIAYYGGDDNPFVNHLKNLLCSFGENDPRRPFGKWQQVDP